MLILVSIQSSCGPDRQVQTTLATVSPENTAEVMQTFTPSVSISATPQITPSTEKISINNVQEIVAVSKWDVGPINQETVLQDFIIDVAWSQNKSEFAVSAYKDDKGGIEVFRTNTQERVCFFEDIFRSSLMYSPEDDSLAGSRLSPSYISIWDTNTCEIIQEIGSSDCIPGRYLAYTLDGQNIITAYEVRKDPFESIIDLWDVETGQCINEFQSFDGIITSLDILQRNNFLITTFIRMEEDPSKQVLIIDSNSSEVLCAIPGIMFAFNQENDILAVLSDDYRGISIWESETCNLVSTFQTNMDVISFDVDPSGKYLAIGGEIIQFWDIFGEKLLEIDKISEYIEDISFSPDGKYVLTASSSHPGKKSELTLWGIID